MIYTGTDFKGKLLDSMGKKISNVISYDDVTGEVVVAVSAKSDDGVSRFATTLDENGNGCLATARFTLKGGTLVPFKSEESDS